jgi:hypothetical protein
MGRTPTGMAAPVRCRCLLARVLEGVLKGYSRGTQGVLKGSSRGTKKGRGTQGALRRYSGRCRCLRGRRSCPRRSARPRRAPSPPSVPPLFAPRISEGYYNVPLQAHEVLTGYSVRRQRAMGGRQRDSLSVLPWGSRPRDTMPVGIPCRVGYHAGWDTMPGGIPRRVGYHAGWDTTPGGIPRRVGNPCRVGKSSSRAFRAVRAHFGLVALEWLSWWAVGTVHSTIRVRQTHARTHARTQVRRQTGFIRGVRLRCGAHELCTQPRNAGDRVRRQIRQPSRRGAD